ncbi:hypothetical protein GOODEAATRI_009506 [Goodea atripinnis]|uniref:Secreted protein n=1 Tax=Goodea atripinnis TaxID=208336 RepID=A0ABV0N988_9TELE
MGPGVRSGHVMCGLFFTHVRPSLSWVVPALLDHGPGNEAGFAAGRHDQSESRMECLSSTPFSPLFFRGTDPNGNRLLFACLNL